MKRRTLWNLSVLTVPEAEEAIMEMFGEIFGRPASAYHDLETGITRVTVFLDRKPDWSGAARARLREGLRHIHACGLKTGSGEFRLAKVRQEDWAESWKRHFQPIEIKTRATNRKGSDGPPGPSLLVKPSWSRRQPCAGQAVIELDPGLSFGTGQHPTTVFCLEELVTRRVPDERQSFLDMGTGSGILAIAAAKLGYSPVAACDFDPEALRTARANARENGVAQRIRFGTADVSKLPARAARTYDVVCANLISNLLVAARKRILARVAPGGVLVLAGILATEFDEVRRVYESAGLRMLASATRNEWRSVSFSNTYP